MLDDANDPDCRQLVEDLHDGRFVYVSNLTPLRPALNHSKGIQLARAPYISILNHDDLWTPDVLRNLVPVLDREPAAVAVFARARVANEHGTFDETRTIEVWRDWRCTNYPVGLILDWFSVAEANPSIPAGPCTLFRASVLKQISIPAVVGGMYDAWIGYKVAAAGPVVHEESAIGLWREHSDNLTRARSKKRSMERIYFNFKLSTDSALPAERRVSAAIKLPRSLAAWAKDAVLGARKVDR